MNQTTLWHDTIFDALGTAVQAAGGTKRVAGRLWPTLGSDIATARLRSALNPEHPQKLCPEELVVIGRMARDVGDNSLMEFLGRELANEVTPIAPADAKKLARRQRRLALLDELKRLEDEE